MHILPLFHRLLPLALLLVSVLITPHAVGVVDIYSFEDESLRDRYFQLSEELRCPKCQNQNLAGSDSQIAGDLRRELRRLLEEGKTDPEIKQFMVDRYGEFVLYKPRLQKSTMVLWGLPILLLVIGGIAVAMITQRKKSQNADEPADGTLVVAESSTDVHTLSEQEQAKLDQLLTSSTSSPSQKEQS